MEPGSSHLSAEQVIAEVIASVMLKPVGSQALFLVLLRGMGRRYTGAGQGALPHSAVSRDGCTCAHGEWGKMDDTSPAVFSWDILGIVYPVYSVTLSVILSSLTHTYAFSIQVKKS